MSITERLAIASALLIALAACDEESTRGGSGEMDSANVAAARGAPDGAPSNHSPATDAELHPYAVQMHLHGSLSEGQGSMRGHLEAARRLGSVDVLWWSDHDWRIALHTYQRGFDFESGSLDTVIVVPGRRREKRLAHGAANAESCRVSWTGRGRAVRHPDERVEVVAAPGGRPGRAGRWSAAAPGSEVRSFARAFVADRDRTHFPLGARLRVRFALYVEEMAPAGARAVVSFVLSQQPPDNRQGVVNFVVGDAGARAARWSADSLRVADVPLDAPAGRWIDVRLDIAREAERLGLGGADNSLCAIEVGLETRDGARATIYIDDFAIEEEIRGDALLEWQQEFVTGAAAGDSISQLVGIEISYGRHVNYFGPALALPDFAAHPNGFDAIDAVAFAHEHGGLASLNHVFGTADEESDERESPDDRFATILDELTRSRCYGADLIEIGYPTRALTIEHFLALWDSLWSRDILIPGTGVSDSHNNAIGWRDGNNFVTWIWARSMSREDLLEGLRAGALAFGNPALLDGDVMLSTSDGHRMGEVVDGVGEESRHEFRLRVKNADPSWHAIAVLSGERRTPIPFGTVARDEEIVFESPTPPGSHVRCEIRDGAGAIIACTNPIAFVSEAPAGVDVRRRAPCAR
jgi:hypothetical protein